MSFPPQPVFPLGIDNDYTLFLVHNTTETRICKESVAWSDEIEIVPVRAGQREIWADNGFGNISGELFYYDSVAKNADGKVYKLKQCARNLGGKPTKYNPPGTWVRAYVVAEHHNQMVGAIFQTEDFVGYNFDPRTETLDWRIRNLEALEVIFDDFSCPDVTFTFNVTENSPTTGILSEYLIEITATGSTGAVTFRLDFGDGEFTTTELSGTHRYALNATIDPVLTITNDKCQLIVTPVERDNPAEPPEIIQEVFDIPIPEVPNVPDFLPVPCDVPEADINLPPFVFPCISLEGQIGPLPSVIEGPDINLVSQVLIEANNPINITQSVVEIIGGPINIPSIVFIDVPPTIVIDPPIPPTIVIVADSTIELGLNATDLPKLQVEWNMPEMNIALTLPKRTRMVPVNDDAIEDFGDEFADLMLAQKQMRVEVEEVGIPEEIRIIPPTMPKVEFEMKDFPRSIKVDTSEANIPDGIKIYGPEVPLPTKIQINGPDKPLPDEIALVNRDVPTTIELISKTVIPESIIVELSRDIPNRIVVETLTPIPERILLEAVGIPTELRVVGIPDTIEVTGFPEFIPLRMPENAQVEMVYRGAPIEVRVDLQPISANNENGEQAQCVMIVPCPR